MRKSEERANGLTKKVEKEETNELRKSEERADGLTQKVKKLTDKLTESELTKKKVRIVSMFRNLINSIDRCSQHKTFSYRNI